MNLSPQTGFEPRTFWLTAKVLDYCESPSHEPGSQAQGSTLCVGSAAGYDVGTQFTPIEAGPGGQKTLIEVRRIDEPLISTAQIVAGPTDVKVCPPVFENRMSGTGSLIDDGCQRNLPGAYQPALI